MTEHVSGSVLTAELTLDDGSVVYVPEGVHAPAAASRGQVVVRVPAGCSADHPVVRLVVRNARLNAELSGDFCPSVRVQPGDTIDVTFTEANIGNLGNLRWEDYADETGWG